MRKLLRVTGRVAAALETSGVDSRERGLREDMEQQERERMGMGEAPPPAYQAEMEMPKRPERVYG